MADLVEIPARGGSEGPVIRLTIPGQPDGKRRHRTKTRDHRGQPLPFPVQHPDPKTAKYERKVQRHARAAGIRKASGPLALSLCAYFECPKSHRLKTRRRGERPHTGRPDLDNIEKTILDALEGIAFENDSQVCEHREPFFKRYAAQGEPARVEVVLFALEPETERSLFDGSESAEV